MIKTEINLIPSVNSGDVIRFIEQNSENDWNESCNIYADEFYSIIENQKDGLETIIMEDEHRISKIIVVNLQQHDGWIKKFTETQEIS